jgi:secretion/DNA translocation related CpaE-like protein
VVIAGSSGARQLVLIIGSDIATVDEVRRCAVACGVDTYEALSFAQARSQWVSANFVVVIDDSISRRGVDALPPHPRLVVVTRDAASPSPWRLAVDIGADRVIDISDSHAVLISYFTEQIRARAHVVGVIAGSGGAGASVTAAALVMSGRARGYRCVLVDADAESAGADLLLGLDETPGLRWHHLSPSAGPPPGEQLFSALPRSGDCAVITRDRSAVPTLDPHLIRSTIHALSGVVDLIVVDLPRGAIELRLELAAESNVVFVVVTCDLRGATSARNIVDSLRDQADVHLLARRSQIDSLDPQDVSDWLELPLAGVLPVESGIVSAVDRGEPICSHKRSRLLASCSELLAGRMT